MTPVPVERKPASAASVRLKPRFGRFLHRNRWQTWTLPIALRKTEIASRDRSPNKAICVAAT